MTEIRKFGLLFSIIFLGLSFFMYQIGNALLYLFVFLFMLFIYLTFFRQNLLNFFFRIWMKFAKILSRIMTPVIFLLMYVFIFVPIGVIFKISNRRSDTRKSYWVSKSGMKEDSNMSDQF